MAQDRPPGVDALLLALSPFATRGQLRDGLASTDGSYWHFLSIVHSSPDGVDALPNELSRPPGECTGRAEIGNRCRAEP